MPIRVLIVDDDPAFREQISRALRQRGYDVVGTASTLSDARAAIADLAPDAVLLDVNLPDGDGIAFATEVRATEACDRVLLTSSDPAAAPSRVVRRAGAAGFVPKIDLAVTDLRPLLGG